MNLRLILAGIGIVVLAVVLSDTMFTVHQTQQALIVRFGDHQRTISNDPGLHFKVPFVDEVVYYEARILDVDPPPQELTLVDQRRLIVDSFIRYQIVDPLEFYRSVQTEIRAVDQLTAILDRSLRDVLARYSQQQVLSPTRAVIMAQIQEYVEAETGDLGVRIRDVRIGRADVPDQVRESIFARMRSAREREAGEIRAEGVAQAERIRAYADFFRVSFLARARRLAEITRGQGDREAIETLANAHSLDPSFFAFYRTLAAYRQAMATEDTALVLSPDGDFFRFFQDVAGGGAALATTTPENLEDLILPQIIPFDEASGASGAADSGDIVPDTVPDVTPDATGDEASVPETADGEDSSLWTVDGALDNAQEVPQALVDQVGVDAESALDTELTDVLDQVLEDQNLVDSITRGDAPTGAGSGFGDGNGADAVLPEEPFEPLTDVPPATDAEPPADTATE